MQMKSIAIAATLATLSVTPFHAQGSASTKPLTYDVVSIKPNKTGGGNMMINFGTDRYTSTNSTMEFMLRMAYHVETEEQLVGLPGWAASTHFDVEAKMDEETVAALKKMSKDEAQELRRQMIRAMLEDRFKLKAHMEKRELPIYNLVLAKGGTKLMATDPDKVYENAPKGPDGQPRKGGGMMMIGNGVLNGQGVPLSNLTSFLSQRLHRQVFDKTGLKAMYDMSLQWTDENSGPRGDNGAPPVAAAGGAQASLTRAPAAVEGPNGVMMKMPKAMADAPSLAVALDEQLGLKLEATRGPVDTVVVEHLEQPTEN